MVPGTVLKTLHILRNLRMGPKATRFVTGIPFQPSVVNTLSYWSMHKLQRK
jgi:hypothetical protein